MKRQWEARPKAAIFVHWIGILAQTLERVGDWKFLPFSGEDAKSFSGKAQKREKRPEGRRKKSARPREGIGGKEVEDRRQMHVEEGNHGPNAVI